MLHIDRFQMIYRNLPRQAWRTVGNGNEMQCALKVTDTVR